MPETERSAARRRAEGALAAAARAGDLGAFEELVTPYEGRLYRVLSRVLGNDADAEDVLQNSLFKAFEKIASFRAESAFGTWLHRIAMNDAFMWLRKSGGDPVRVVDDPSQLTAMAEDLAPIDDWSRSVEDASLRAEARQVLSRMLATLPEIDRAIVLLKDAEGLSHSEIADATGLTPVAARSRLHRARLILRARLADYFGERADARSVSEA